MNLRPFVLGALSLMFVSFLQPKLALAQQEPQQEQPPIEESQPKPAARSLPGVDNTEEASSADALQPDISPVTGFEYPGVGSAGFRHSYWVPGVQVGSIIGSNPSGGANGSSTWSSETFFLGNLTLLKNWGRAQTFLNYSGGGFVSSGNNQSSSGTGTGSTGYNTGSSSSGSSQLLSLQHQYKSNRWLFQIFDVFSYLPQSQFGFGAGTNLGNSGIGGSLGLSPPTLNTGVIPSQSIYATNGPIYSNTGAIQATYEVTQRSSLTVGADYGILRFTAPGNVDTDSILGSFGYNYQATRKDSIGVFYLFSGLHFAGQPQAYGSHSINVAYSRKITGRLGLQVYAGPQITTFRVPVVSGTQQTTQQTGYDISTNVNYSTKVGGITGNYVHGLSGGSGVLTGSNLNQFSFTVSRKLSRVWSGNANVGYAHNSSVASSGLSAPSYNSTYAGAGVNRPFGRNVYIGISYAAYFSSTSTSNCTGPTCSTSETAHTINLSLQWHSRPFVLE